MIARPASRMPAPGRISGRTRAGFTLIELMGVILIIAILIAIALPAFNAVMRNARVTTARTEVAAIGTAIGEFKAEFGTEPPSYIDFRSLTPETQATLRKMFPQINFTLDAMPPGGNGIPDIIDALTVSGVWGKQLQGSECLVFFLGGVRESEDRNMNGTLDAGEDSNSNGRIDRLQNVIGFSKNPANPFMQQSGQSLRLGPFYDFDTGRLGEVARSSGVISSFELNPDNFQVYPQSLPLGYADKLPGQSRPLLYASTAATGFYRPADVMDLSLGPYRKPGTKNYYNPDSFQIISAGFDTTYGQGGDSVVGQDADNITNFSPGLLGDE